MKNRLIPFVVALALGAALPVVAGPDFQQIERARKAKQQTELVRQGTADAAAASTQQGESRQSLVLPSEPAAAGRPGEMNCPEHPLVLGLDHGPRAQTTPFQNRQREARHEVEMAACQPAAAK
jgi:hypothetical protein